jgi:hypothetical protein
MAKISPYYHRLSPGFYLVISAGVIFILLAVLLIVMKHRKAASIETDK